MRGATLSRGKYSAGTDFISIHAPHAGCDLINSSKNGLHHDFNPRTPCGVRLLDALTAQSIEQFQSTHPMRGATSCRKCHRAGHRISIHAPHAGCDSSFCTSCRGSPEFQSTHPMRGATKYPEQNMLRLISFQSTHPMRGATAICVDGINVRRYFNPRTPCGVRRASSSNLCS